jgi:hypothetical protein
MKNLKDLTQSERVLWYIQEYGSITWFDAYRDLGIARLSAVIYNLLHLEGEPIESITEKGKNRWGEPTHFSRYYLKGSPFEEKLKEEGII